MIGKMIDSYEITELIGRGGMGVVYRARDVKLDRDVALKIMDPLLAREETFLKRFWSEAKALARLQNPYIVAIYALRETEYGICIVMEYVKGTTLGDLIKSSGPLPVEKALRLFKQLLMAFEHAHGAGIIHRDVKPGNILVSDENVAKVTDFGLAKIYQPAAATLTSITGGTLFYASPEQLEGLGKVDQRGDIYSLGMTLYETLTGAVPFANTESDFAIREKIVKGRIPAPRGMKPQIPAELNAIVMKAIAKDPADRYQTATEMREAIENFEISLRRTRAGSAKTSRPALNPRWLLVPAVLLLGLAGFLLYPSLVSSEATISITSKPGGARVLINEKEVGWTPIEKHAIAAGQARVRLTMPGFLTSDTTIRNVSEGESYSLEFAMESEKPAPAPIAISIDSSARKKPEPMPVPPKPQVPRTGTLFVKVNPSSAAIKIDGKPVKSPTAQVSPGVHAVVIQSDRNIWEGKATVVAGRRAEINVDFEKVVKVTVVAVGQDGTPVRGAIGFYDGVPVGPTPANVKVRMGVHTITVKCAGYEDSREKRCFVQDMIYPNSLKIVMKKGG